MNTPLSTDAYKGTRDFYPEDMAVRRYIERIWGETAEKFGYARYDASVLEPAELYKSKGGDNEELVNEQTYTFIDRGEREVTLRPEMTPTAARMIAARRRELSFPVRWYAIPNLFRYERPQRGRLREHWQFNCDLFGVTDYAADVEVITLAYETLISFGAKPEMFEIRISDRAWIKEQFERAGQSEAQIRDLFLLLDRKDKIDNFDAELLRIAGKPIELEILPPPGSSLERVMHGLAELGISNVRISPETVRGFSYYTGTIFEFFDTDPLNNRSIAGGGRYDNLTGLFGGDPIPGVGFGMGDVTLQDFLRTHLILPRTETVPTVAIIPMDTAHSIEAEKIARELRAADVSATIDLSEKKLAKKIGDASDRGIPYVLVVGEEEVTSGTYVLKNLVTREEYKGIIPDLIPHIRR